MDPDPSGSVRVLHVDDDPDFTELTATYVERDHPEFEVDTAASASEGMERLADGAYDCIVADYEMPGTNGVEFLEAIRDSDDDLPFVLFTGKGSEEVASDAISKGATDYLQKRPGTEQYELLANRVRNAVEQYRSEREHERVYQALDTATQGIAILDADEEYVFVNQAHAEIYGYDDPEAFIGRTWRMCYDEEELDRLDAEVMPSLAETGEWRGEATGTRVDGGTFPQELSLTSTDDGALICVVRDVTERKRRERELRETNRQLQAVLDTVEAAIFIKDTEGRYRLMNQECRTLLGVDADEEIVGVTDYDLFPEETAEQFRTDDRRVVERGETIEVEEEVPGEGGTQINLTFKSPLFDEDGEVYGICAVSTDITERVEYARQVERQNERLEEFSSIVSHDLQSPLNVATQRLTLAMEEGDVSHLEPVARAHERMEDMIEDLLTLAREGAAIEELKAIDLATVSDDARESVEAVDVSIGVDGNRTVWADRGRLRQLLENLYRNAEEHAGEGAAVRVGRLDDGFYVADDGVGIPPAKREAVFRKGFTTKDDGTGYGLQIVRQIADAHDWTVRVTDSEAGGALFEFTDVEFVGG